MKLKGYELRLMVFTLHSVDFAGDKMLPLISQMFAFFGSLIFLLSRFFKLFVILFIPTFFNYNLEESYEKCCN